MDNQDIEALRERWKEMYGKTLTSLALSKSPVQKSWPVHVDHCFGRIILDNVIGQDSPWTSKLQSPAVKHMTSEQLRQCIALGSEIADGSKDLVVLDAKSLELRGKKQKAAAKNSKRKREASMNTAGLLPSKRRQVDIQSAFSSPSQTSKDNDKPPPSPPAPTKSASPLRPSSKESDLPTDPSLHQLIATSSLTPFRQRVLLALCQVPVGRFTSYAAISAHLHSSARAVGNALRNNPFAPRVPCHRVVAADRSLGGFGGDWGKEGKFAGEKIRLLRGEGVIVDAGKGKVEGSVWKEFK
ncbi:MAG: hypothetical protein Q9220_001430 [cf. Caloplaca sp. 1 TL-2023]